MPPPPMLSTSSSVVGVGTRHGAAHTYSIAALPALVLHAFPSPSPPFCPSLEQHHQTINHPVAQGKLSGIRVTKGPAGEVIRDRVVIPSSRRVTNQGKIQIPRDRVIRSET
ncbi:hypothetical protein DTO271G3_1250 [Paecilomyces variotii]|nr:hypothetical protein DTO271G3_1250 [Paecilomyces variotii]